MKVRQNISAEYAKDLLLDNKPLIDFYISGILDIVDFDKNDKIIRIENCFVESFKSESVEFLTKIEFANSEFKKCTFSFAYFSGGLNIEKCIFYDYLDFQCGGHNSISNAFMIKNSIFNEFVNFLDCIYNGPVEISDNVFKKGTNLLGNKCQSYKVSFDVLPCIENNKGKIDLNGEGGLKMNLIDMT